MLNKSELSPFTKVKAKNDEVGILVVFQDSEIVCFENTVIFLSRYNDDLTLRDLNEVVIEEELDPELKEYRYNLLSMKDSYYGYEIKEIYKINNFNRLNSVINFNYLKE